MLFQVSLVFEILLYLISRFLLSLILITTRIRTSTLHTKVPRIEVSFSVRLVTKGVPKEKVAISLSTFRKQGAVR